MYQKEYTYISVILILKSKLWLSFNKKTYLGNIFFVKQTNINIIDVWYRYVNLVSIPQIKLNLGTLFLEQILTVAFLVIIDL